MDLQLRRSVIGGTDVLVAAGELDLGTVPQLRNALVQLVCDRPGRTVAIDLDGVTVCDETALGILMGAAARARDANGDLRIVCTDERLLTRFAKTRLDLAIDVVSRVSSIPRR